uniref:Protein kinase domain-containing protein n=1 Tax=Globodera rostochiensis TaxID=31243 RepID=A0A914H3Q9_GLORO
MKNILLIYLFYFSCLNLCSFISAASLANKFEGQISPPGASPKVQRCQCGKHLRNLTATRIIAGKKYDTFVPLGDGLDGKVEHAFSLPLGRCVAVKTCVEDPTRLSKCTREMKVLQRMSGVAPHIVPLEDFQIKRGQPCTEGAVMSDFIRTVIIGSEKRRKRNVVDAENTNTNSSGSESIGDNCNEITLVEELGSDDVEHYLRGLKRSGGAGGGRGALSLELTKTLIKKALDELHENGIAHRDLHKDNAMIFPLPPLVNHSQRCDNAETGGENAKLTVKVIDMGWACCFDAQKCGPSVSAAVPDCAAVKSLHDDEFSLQDVLQELDEL